MIKVRIQEVARTRKIKTPKGERPIENSYLFALAINRPVTTAKRLWEGQLTTISLHMLEVVCLALGCEPGDLLVLPKSASKKSAKR